MFRKSKNKQDQGGTAEADQKRPEKLVYTRYYEHDGALKAYAHRAMLLACLTVPTALVAVSFAAYMAHQPPVVIRVDSNGEAVVAGQASAPRISVTVAQGADAKAADFEKKAFLRLFLDRYYNYSPVTIDQNWADAVNMMTANRRQVALQQMAKDDTVGKAKDDQVTVLFHLRSLEPTPDDPLSFTAFAVKDVHRVRDHREFTQQLVTRYKIRLITEPRSEKNPSGLLIADYGETVIDGENHDADGPPLSLGGSN